LSDEFVWSGMIVVCVGYAKSEELQSSTVVPLRTGVPPNELRASWGRMNILSETHRLCNNLRPCWER